MNTDDVLRKIGEVGIVPVVRADGVDEALAAVEAICEGGITVVEITMTVPKATSVIREVKREHGSRILVGAGTVLDFEQASDCLDAGAEFLVSPGLSLSVLKAAKEARKLAIPGALTPTELMAAIREGVRAVKIFPCGSVGGPKHIRSLRAPFPDMKLIPTGGVNLTNAAEYFAAGAFALGVGADLVNLKALRDGKRQEIVSVAKKLAALVHDAHTAKVG